jgi:hypothetical protein
MREQAGMILDAAILSNGVVEETSVFRARRFSIYLFSLLPSLNWLFAPLLKNHGNSREITTITMTVT